MAAPTVHSTHLSSSHSFSKTYTPSITLIANHGVDGDIHSGPTVQKSSLATTSPSLPNLRQVHLIPYELFTTLASESIAVAPGELGENITTYGIDLVRLPRGTHLYFGEGNDCAVVLVTGLRDPGEGVERHRPGLLGRLKWVDKRGKVGRRCGIMGVVAKGGEVRTGDTVRVVLPEERIPLGPV